MTPEAPSPSRNGPTSPSEPSAPAPEGVVRRGKRLSRYLSWHLIEVTLNLGLAPIVLFPLCRYFGDAESFGQFVYALGIVNLVGLAPTKGLNNCILRDIAGVSPDRRPLLLRTAFSLATVVVGGIAVLGILACLVTGSVGAAAPRTVTWIAVLVVALAARNITTVGTVDLTADRRFPQRAVWRTAGTLFSFLALPGLFLIGPSGIAMGYACGYVFALLGLVTARRRVFIGRPQFDRGMGKQVTAIWGVLSLGAVFIMSPRYVHRIMLGASDSFEAVTVFFAAAVALGVCVMPVSALGVFGFQLLSAHRSRQRFTARFLRMYALITLVGAVAFYEVVVLLSPWLLRRLYPHDAGAAHAVLPIMAIGVAMSILMHASRPFVMKFAPARALLGLGVASLVAHVGPALILIPRWGLPGAAWAFSIGHSVVGLTWFGVFVGKFLRPETASNGESPTDDLEPG